MAGVGQVFRVSGTGCCCRDGDGIPRECNGSAAKVSQGIVEGVLVGFGAEMCRWTAAGLGLRT